MTVATETQLTIRVFGRPAKQGSKDFKGMRGGHPILVEADTKLPAWRKAVIAAARNAMTATRWATLDGPIDIDATVYLPRPASVTRQLPTSQNDGDGDKYLRACCDALTLARVWVDDSRATDQRIRKRYADHRPPGALIVVRPVDPARGVAPVERERCPRC